ncbi:hypothetical protein ACRAWD_09200 [Caulobacter segnis]
MKASANLRVQQRRDAVLQRRQLQGASTAIDYSTIPVRQDLQHRRAEPCCNCR